MTPADRDEIPGTDDLDTDVNLVDPGFADFRLPDDIPTPIRPDGSVDVADFNLGDRDKVAAIREHMRRLRDATPCPIWNHKETEL